MRACLVGALGVGACFITALTLLAPLRLALGSAHMDGNARVARSEGAHLIHLNARVAGSEGAHFCTSRQLLASTAALLPLRGGVDEALLLVLLVLLMH